MAAVPASTNVQPSGVTPEVPLAASVSKFSHAGVPMDARLIGTGVPPGVGVGVGVGVGEGVGVTVGVGVGVGVIVGVGLTDGVTVGVGVGVGVRVGDTLGVGVGVGVGAPPGTNETPLHAVFVPVVARIENAGVAVPSSVTATSFDKVSAVLA